MMRTLATAAFVFTAVASAAQTPAPVATSSFDVVSVKESAPLPVNGGVTIRPSSPDPGGGWSARNATLLEFDYAGSRGVRAATDSAPGGPSIFTAVPEQLGLKLERHRDPIDVLVIDAVTLPTAN